MKRYTLILVAALLLMISSLVPAFAQEDMGESYIVTFTDEAVDFPEEVNAGFVTFTFDNTKTGAPVVLDLVRLNVDVTPESFLEALQASEDPSAALALVTLYGGTQVNPGSSVEISYELEAGTYVLLDFAGAPSIFTVVGDAEATQEATEDAMVEATADADDGIVEVELDDFVFIVPEEIQAGENVWQISNVGEQWHEMAIYHITDENLTDQDVINFLFESLSATEETSLEGLEDYGVWLPMSPEQEAWVNWDFEPGRYVFVCFLPDISNTETMHSHLELGMIRVVTITAEAE